MKVLENCCSGLEMACDTQTACFKCGETGRPVWRQTVVHHVKSIKLASVGNAEYKFCATKNCPVVYYADSGQEFTIEDVRELVTSKTEGDARPLCYCFGYTEGDVRKEIETTGKSTAAAQVSQFIKERFCACDTRNPSGVCCLGNINKAVKHLSEEYQSVNESVAAEEVKQTDCWVETGGRSSEQ